MITTCAPHKPRKRITSPTPPVCAVCEEPLRSDGLIAGTGPFEYAVNERVHVLADGRIVHPHCCPEWTCNP